MRISFGQSLSKKQTQKLAPGMIQSMEILRRRCNHRQSCGGTANEDCEDKSKLYSDVEIQTRLKNLGFTVARRTVAKYREKLDIRSSRQRRDWSKKRPSE